LSDAIAWARIALAQPYDEISLLEFFRKRAVRGVEHVDALGYRRSIGHDGKAAWLSVAFDTATGHLNIGLGGAAVHDAPYDDLRVVERVAAMFDVEAEAVEIEQSLGSDPMLASLGMRGMRVPGAWDPFELGVRAILGQQVTVAAARTLASRLCEQFGGQSRPDPTDRLTRTFPGPETLADAAIAAVGLSRRRAETIRSFARAVASGVIDFDTPLGRKSVPERMLGIPGIGPWTVGYVTMRALKDPDAFPSADIALIRAAQRLGIAEDARGLERASQRWRPWRAYAAVRLWSSLAAA